MRPLFYSCVGPDVRVSNTLSSLRDGYDDSTELDDSFIADFLTFEFSLTPEATAYRNIRRLPPAHFMTVRPDQSPRIQRYWDLPAPAIDMKLNPGETLHRFRCLLKSAVLDRLPDGPVSLWLSGGMDSTAIAAVAAGHVSANPGGIRLASFTAGLREAARDPEPPLAALVARHLGVPHRLFDIEPHGPFERWDEHMPFMPEPWHEPYWGRKVIGLHEVATESRVTIGGEGGDELLSPELTLELIGPIPARRLALDVIRHLARYHRLPPMGVRKTVQRWRGERPNYGEFSEVPPWLNRDFAAEWRVAERIAHLFRTADDPTPHPSRPMGMNRLGWSTEMTRGCSDPGTIGLPLELRKPFLDVRLVEFMYSIPPLYWCSRKAILREALADRLPEQILRRPKTSVPGNLLWDHIQKFGMPWHDEFQPAWRLQRYVDLPAWHKVCERARRASTAPPTLLRDLLPVSLNYWLRSIAGRPDPCCIGRGVSHDEKRHASEHVGPIGQAGVHEARASALR
jgi:asparagine synthase (glutamine-hydrolysing)